MPGTERKTIMLADCDIDTFFVGIAKGTGGTSDVPVGVLQMKLENGLAVLCWQDKANAISFFELQPPAVSNLNEIAAVTRTELRMILSRSGRDSSKTKLLLMD